MRAGPVHRPGRARGAGRQRGAVQPHRAAGPATGGQSTWVAARPPARRAAQRGRRKALRDGRLRSAQPQLPAGADAAPARPPAEHLGGGRLQVVEAAVRLREHMQALVELLPVWRSRRASPQGARAARAALTRVPQPPAARPPLRPPAAPACGPQGSPACLSPRCAEALEIDFLICQSLEGIMNMLDHGGYSATPLLLFVSLKHGNVQHLLLQLLASRNLEELLLKGQVVLEVRGGSAPPGIWAPARLSRGPTAAEQGAPASASAPPAADAAAHPPAGAARRHLQPAGGVGAAGARHAQRRGPAARRGGAVAAARGAAARGRPQLQERAAGAAAQAGLHRDRHLQGHEGGRLQGRPRGG